MKMNLLILLGIVGLVLLSSWAMTLRHPPVAVSAVSSATTGAPLPAFSFRTIEGKTVRSADLRGHRAILNFWASWCMPCVEEMPRLLQAAEDGDDVRFILMSVDEDPQALPRFLKKLDPQSRRRLKLANVLVARDADKTISQDLFQTVSLPETILIDRNLVMRGKLVGADWDMDNLRQRLQELSVP